MKRTEKKLRSKGIKTYKPKARFYYCHKYYRAFVANHLGDATFVPFSRTSMMDDWERDDHINHSLRHYLKRFFRKQVGKNVDEVFHDFRKLGWKHSYEMHYYWEKYVDPHFHRFHYSIDDNGCLVRPTQQNHSSPPYKNDKMEKNEEKPKAKRPRASEKRLTRKHLEHNESVITANVSEDGYGSASPGLLGKMYVEHEHKVIEHNVYLVKVPYNPHHHTPVSVLGLYREERRYYYDCVTTQIVTTFNKKEQILEAQIVQDKSESGELIPCI